MGIDAGAGSGGRAGAVADGDGAERVLVTLRVRSTLRVRGLAGVGNVRGRVRQRGRVLSGDGGLRVRVMCGCGLSGCGESAGVGNVAGGGFVWVWVERVRGKCGGGGNEGCGESAGRKKQGAGKLRAVGSGDARVRENCGEMKRGCGEITGSGEARVRENRGENEARARGNSGEMKRGCGGKFGGNAGFKPRP